MAVNLQAPTQLLPVAGVATGAVCAGIKQTVRPDLTLFRLAPGSVCAAVFTRNAFCAAPVIVARQHLTTHAPRYWLINSGNANAGTGALGMDAALSCCAVLAEQGECAPAEVLPFSTGVIGQTLPVAKITQALPAALAALRPDGWLEAAQAIMTTDTLAKGLSVQTEIDGKTVTVTGIAKGSGMIRPDMATMLAFIATDAAVSETVLRTCLETAANLSFNRISVDGDTSTNDACVLAATGQAANIPITESAGADFNALQEALNRVCTHLAQAIVRDGEGATKFIRVIVEEGANLQECLDVAYTIAHSPLIKTAFFASDPNWGRILAAVGRAGLLDLDLDKIRIYLDEVCIVRNGGCAPEYSEAQGQAVMKQAEISVRVCLGRGEAETTVWTCDFSYDYVKINAEYRT
jgi:glutamate N-acetyltransferase / amino-acid N-acetyltransferase